MTELDFNTMVLASRDEEVQALRAMPAGSAARMNQGLVLVNAGKILNYNTDVLGQSDFVWMNFDISLGYKWIPSAGMTPSADTSVYMTLPIPAGAIKVSIDPADYPVWVKPGNPVPAPGAKWVNDQVVACTTNDGHQQYQRTPECLAQQGSPNPIPNGMEYTENDANGEPHIYHASYPVPTPENPGQRPLPGWILWERQNP